MIFKRDIDHKVNSLGSIIRLIYLSLLITIIASCGNSKDVTEKHPEEGSQKFKITFHEAVREKMIGNYDKSILLFEKCLIEDNASSAANYALSDIYQIIGDKSKAIFYGEKAYELDKENKWYILNLAHLYFDMGHYHKSAEYFDLGLDDNEQNIDLKFKYAKALIYSNQREKAIKIINDIEVETGKIPELSLTKHDLYLELGEEEKAQKELDDLIASDPENTDYRLIVAEYFMNTNQFVKAEKIAREILKLDSTTGGAYIILADVDLRKGNLKGTFDNLENGFKNEGITIERKLELIWSLVSSSFSDNQEDIKMMEDRLSILFNLIYEEGKQNDLMHNYYGIFLRNQGKYGESKKEFSLAIEINPDSYNYWMQLLNVEYELEDYKNMSIDGEKAVELFPSQPMFYLLTGIGNYESGQFEQAEEWLYLGKDLVIKDDELLAEFLYHMGKVSCLKKEYEEGYKSFELSKLKFSGNIKVYNAKALFLLEEEKINDAELEIIKALGIMPVSPMLLDTYGLILIKKKDYSAAIIRFENALLNSPGNGIIMEHLGDALYLNGEKNKAVQMWKNAKTNGNVSELLDKKIADQTYYEN